MTNQPIVLDARAELDSHPIALVHIFGKPLIHTFLQMVAEAKALDRLTVLVEPDFAERIRTEISKFSKADQVLVVTESPPTEKAVTAEINRVYVRRTFIGAIRGNEREIPASQLAPITSASTLKAAEEFAHKDAPGHRTPLLRLVYRPVSRIIARGLAKTPVTPNGVTLLGLLIIPVIAGLLAQNNYVYGLIAAGLINIVMVLDMIDGDLARLTNNRSRFGEWFDGVADNLFAIAVASTFGIGAVVSTGNIWFAVPAVLWLTGYVSAHSNFLHEMIERAGDREYELAITDVEWNVPGPLGRLGNAVRKGRWALAQPEIIRAIYTTGLIIGRKEIVVVFFGTFYTLIVIRMLTKAYAEYRRTEINRTEPGG